MPDSSRAHLLAHFPFTHQVGALQTFPVFPGESLNAHAIFRRSQTGNKSSGFNALNSFCHHRQGAKGPAANDGLEQQQGAMSVAPMNQSIQWKVTVTGGHQQAAGRALQANRGAMGHQQHNRVRHKWGLWVEDTGTADTDIVVK